MKIIYLKEKVNNFKKILQNNIDKGYNINESNIKKVIYY